MKRIISLILIYFMLMPSFVVLAEEAVLVTEGECRDGLLWSYKDGTLTISGEGEMAHYMEIRGPWDGQYPYFYPKPWAEFSEQVKTIVIEKGVTKIGGHAFIDCVNLEKVVLDSVRAIDDNAFTDTNLKEIEYCDELMYIGRSALSGTPFAANNKLIIVDGRLLYDASISTLKGTYTVPEGVTAIGDGLFEFSDVNEVILPDTLEIIGKEAFRYCDKLTYITLPDSVRVIDDFAFASSGLTDIKMPKNLEYVGKGAFRFTYISEFTLKKGVTYGGDASEGVVSF